MSSNEANNEASAVRTFAFVDLAGFTALTEAHGDETALDVVERFVDRARTAVCDRGALVKTIGDAVMLVFASPADALLATRELFERCGTVPAVLAPRAGLHHGPALRRGDDWFGATVNLAARVAGQAFGGQTLATADVASTARALDVPVVDLGGFHLKNISEPIELFQIELVPPPEAVSIDPVCRMLVDHASAAGRLRHGDTDFWFCSMACVQAFAADPARYVDLP